MLAVTRCYAKFKLMNYDLEAIDYKIPHTEEDSRNSSKEHSSGRVSRLQVKGMLERYRKEVDKE
jgi:hypothetical protein